MNLGMKIYVLVISLAIGSVKGRCPSKCICSESMVNCTDAGLEMVPNLESLEVEPSQIDLSSNEIIAIQSTDFSFDGNEKVEYLYLSRNSIVDVNERALIELTGVLEVSFSTNALESVSPMLISENKNLVLLDLSNNFFTINAPSLHSDSLEVLDLSSSKIATFTEDNLKYLPNLKILNLSFNSLKAIEPSVFDLQNLLVVDVSYNIWKCNQDTIDLFDFLTKHNLTVPEEPVKCVTEDRTYHDIFTKDGPIYNNTLVIGEPSQDIQSDSNGLDLLEAFKEATSQEDEDSDEYDIDLSDDYWPNDYPQNKELEIQNVADEKEMSTADYNLTSTSDEEIEIPEMDVAIFREDQYIVLYEQQQSRAKANRYGFYFTNNLIVLLGVMAFSLTFLIGILFGVCVFKDSLGKRRRRDINGSTNTLISKLSQDIA